MNNEELKHNLEKFQTGNIDVFYDIYEELKTPLYTIIYRILYDHMLSEDVMQDVFIRIFQTPPSLQIEKPRAWIFQMARNLAIDCKRRIRESEPLSDKTELHDVRVEMAVNTKLDLESALKCLSLEEREIVTLYLNGELKFREIAELIEKPLGTVIWRYQKAIKKVRQLLIGGA